MTIVVVSNKSDRAYYEREEIAAAIELSRSMPTRHRVIPVYIGDTLGGPIPYGLRIKHGLFVTNDVPMNDTCRRLVEALPQASGPPLKRVQSFDIDVDVDLCMCIDVSSSLQWLVQLARRQLLTLGHDITQRMLESRKSVDRLRVRLITFGSDAYPIQQTPMIELPGGASMLYEAVSGLHIESSGFSESRGLNALAEAFRSDWSQGGQKRRQVVTVWTDRATAQSFDFDELTAMWEDQMSPASKRLVLFAPDRPMWSDISSYWEQCVHYVVNADGGFTDVDYDAILSTVVNSV